MRIIVLYVNFRDNYYAVVTVEGKDKFEVK